MKKLIFLASIILTAFLLFHFTKKKEDEFKLVKATVYTIDPRQTDNTPTITASGFKLNKRHPKKHRVIAISRDLKIEFGKRVRIEGAGKYDGIYQVQDLMNSRWKNRIDILIDPHDHISMYDSVKLYIL